jgi:hypothetical protein
LFPRFVDAPGVKGRFGHLSYSPWATDVVMGGIVGVESALQMLEGFLMVSRA